MLAMIGALALGLSLFAPWYRIELSAALRQGIDQLGQQILTPAYRGVVSDVVARLPHSISGNAWQVFTITDVVLAIAAALVIALSAAAAGAFGSDVRVDAGWVGRTTAATGMIAAAFVAYRMIDPRGPHELIKLAYGAWVALVGAISMLIGGLASTAEPSAQSAAAITLTSFDPPTQPRPGSIPPPGA
jgi:hypothetical protein